MMTEAITWFRGEYDFLSNFYPSDVALDGVDYPTVEHAFQAAKTFDHEKRAALRRAATPKSAKAMGRRLKRREDWFEVSLQIMEDLVRDKFTRHADLRERLLATGDAELVEGNNWNDRFYGAVYNSHTETWDGENHLGRILMKVRDELRESAS